MACGPEPDRSACYSLYGVSLVSDFAFANRLARAAESAAGHARLTFECVSQAPVGWSPPGEAAYASPVSPADGQSSVVVHRLDGCLLMRFRTADFYLEPGRIVCHLPDEDYRYLVELQILGVVLAVWLEWRGVPALHASAISLGGWGAAFLSAAGGGKSSIAMSLMREGHSLLTDDILAVGKTGTEYVGHPGYPQVRMWPDQVERFAGSEEGEIVHPAFSKRRLVVGEGGFGSFYESSLPMTRLYLPERRSGASRVEISPVPPREALMHLVGNSFVAPIVEALGLQPHRLGTLAGLLSQAPVRRVVYPDGFDNLPRLYRAILRDVAAGDVLEESAR